MTKHSGIGHIVLAGLAAGALALLAVGAQHNVARGQASASKDELAQNFAAEHEIGRRFRVDPNDLPAPKTPPIVTNRSLTVPFDGQTVQVPPGFTATPFATGLANPRRLLVLPNGDVLVAEQSAGYLTLLRDDGSGHAVWIDRHVEDLNKPYGLALRGDEILVADQDGIWRVPHVVGALRAGRPAPPQRADQLSPDQRKPVPGAYGAQMLTKKGVFGIVQGHANRHLAIDPKSGALYVGVGSSGNLGVEPEPKATIQRFDADGTNQMTVASGTRNPTALAFHPDTGELWAVVQERDGLGDNLPSDYLIRVQQGGFYGWPYAYIGKHPQPGFANLAPDKVDGDDNPRSVVPGAFLTARPRVLSGRSVPARIQGQPVRRIERLVEPLETDRLQARARAVQGRPAGRLLREFRDRLLGLGRAARRSLGPPRRTRGRQGRLLARRRRHRRHDLADLLQGPARRARRRTGGEDGTRGENPGSGALIRLPKAGRDSGSSCRLQLGLVSGLSV